MQQKLGDTRMFQNNQKQIYTELNQSGERYEDKKPHND